MQLDPFYPIFDHADWVNRLVPLGIKLVQLRIKDANADEITRQVQHAQSVCAKHDCQLIVNDYWRLAIDNAWNYIHLGQEDLDSADVPAIKRAGIRIGISTHSEEELDRAMDNAPDYVALGPIYPTILKKMPWAPQGLDRIQQWKKVIGDLPLIGIGGLNPERGRQVLEAGADVVSVVTDITLNQNPEAQVKHWVNVTQPYST